jgi:hypothetical protein
MTAATTFIPMTAWCFLLLATSGIELFMFSTDVTLSARNRDALESRVIQPLKMDVSFAPA